MHVGDDQSSTSIDNHSVYLGYLVQADIAVPHYHFFLFFPLILYSFF